MKHSNRQEEEKTERKNSKIDKIVWIVMCIVLGIITFTANTLRMKNDSLKTQVELKTSEITEYEEAIGTPAEKTFIGKLDFELPRIDEITWYCPPNLYLTFLQGKNGKDTVIAKTYRNYSDMTEIHIDCLGREELKDIIAKQDYKKIKTDIAENEMTDANGNHVQEWKYELYKNRNHIIAFANYDNHNVSIEYDSIKTITSFNVEDVDSIIWSLWWDDSKKEEIIDREFE